MAMEGEAKLSSDFCICLQVFSKYTACGHDDVITIYKTPGCPVHCATRGETRHTIHDPCPKCSPSGVSDGDSASGGNQASPRALEDEEDDGNHSDGDSIFNPPDVISRDPSLAPAQMRAQINKVEAKLSANQPSSHATSAKKAEQANKELKKFIATLTLTGPIKKIFGEAEKETKRAHEYSWEWKANKYLLELESAVKDECWEEVTRLKFCMIEEGRSFKATVNGHLKAAQKEVLKQCEEGVERMLEALEKTSL